MELIKQLFDTLVHLSPDSINAFVVAVGPTISYTTLFLIIFAETGLVVTPFLPGDSLLFAVGAVTAHPSSPIQLGRPPCSWSSPRSWATRSITASATPRAACLHARGLPAPEQEAPAASPRILREVRRPHDHPGAVHPDRPDIRPVRRRHRQDELFPFRPLQRGRRRRLGPLVPGRGLVVRRTGGRQESFHLVIAAIIVISVLPPHSRCSDRDGVRNSRCRPEED